MQPAQSTHPKAKEGETEMAMIEWFLILTLYTGREAPLTPIPMQSLEACLAARQSYVAIGINNYGARFTRCLNTKTGEIRP